MICPIHHTSSLPTWIKKYIDLSRFSPKNSICFFLIHCWFVRLFHCGLLAWCNMFLYQSVNIQSNLLTILCPSYSWAFIIIFIIIVRLSYVMEHTSPRLWYTRNHYLLLGPYYCFFSVPLTLNDFQPHRSDRWKYFFSLLLLLKSNLEDNNMSRLFEG